MTVEMIFAFLILPLLVGAMGTTAYVVFMRYDDAQRRNEAKADRTEG